MCCRTGISTSLVLKVPSPTLGPQEGSFWDGEANKGLLLTPWTRQEFHQVDPAVGSWRTEEQKAWHDSIVCAPCQPLPWALQTVSSVVLTLQSGFWREAQQGSLGAWGIEISGEQGPQKADPWQLLSPMGAKA